MSDELRERVARAIEAADLAYPHAPFNYLAFADAAIALIWNEAMEEAAKVAKVPSGLIDNEDSYARGYRKATIHIAAALLAMKDKT